jgi:hypothetical protein
VVGWWGVFLGCLFLCGRVGVFLFLCGGVGVFLRILFLEIFGC